MGLTARLKCHSFPSSRRKNICPLWAEHTKGVDLSIQWPIMPRWFSVSFQHMASENIARNLIINQCNVIGIYIYIIIIYRYYIDLLSYHVKYNPFLLKLAILRHPPRTEPFFFVHDLRPRNVEGRDVRRPRGAHIPQSDWEVSGKSGVSRNLICFRIR